MSVYKRRSVWWVSMTVDGREIRRSLGTRDRDIAELKALTLRRFLQLRKILQDDVELRRLVREFVLKDRRHGWLYFARASTSGLIKIGFAKSSVEKRLVQIKTYSGPVELLGKRRGSFEDEQKLHRHLLAHCQHGEWFTDCEAVRGAIQQNPWAP